MFRYRSDLLFMLSPHFLASCSWAFVIHLLLFLHLLRVTQQFQNLIRLRHIISLLRHRSTGTHGSAVHGRHNPEGEICSKYNDGTLPHSYPHLIFSFRNLSLAVRGRLQSFVPYPLLLPSYVVFSTVAPTFTFPFVSFTSRMGRRRTAEDYQPTAEENGWVPGAHEEEDSKQQTKDEPSDRYKTEPAGGLDQWMMWVPDSADQLYVDAGCTCLGVFGKELSSP